MSARPTEAVADELRALAAKLSTVAEETPLTMGERLTVLKAAELLEDQARGADGPDIAESLGPEWRDARRACEARWRRA